MNEQHQSNNNSNSDTTLMTERELQEQEIRKLRQENAQLKEEIRLRNREKAQLKSLVLKTMQNKRIDWEKDISQEMKQDGEFLEAAVIQGHVRWDFVPEPRRSNPDFVLAVLRQGRIRWEHVPEDLKRTHFEIAEHGVRYNLIDPDDCPCLMDRSRMREHLTNGEILWNHVPTSMRTDIGFARSIERFPDLTTVDSLFQHFPQLQQERNVWKKIVETENMEFAALYDALHLLAPDEILSDRELMLQACAKDAEVLGLLDERPEHLNEDHEFPLELAGRNTAALKFISHEVQLRFPDIVDRALQQSIEGDSQFEWRLYTQIAEEALAPEFWNNRDFVFRWFQLGLPFVDANRFQELKEDKEIFLLVAQYCAPRFRQQSFRNASLALRSDRKFMLQVLEIAPSLLSEAGPQLRKDFDACLVAFSSEQSVVQSEVVRRQALVEDGHGFSEHDYVELFRSRVSAHLGEHRTFTTILLPAMSQTTESGCALAVLNQGAETSRSYKKRIAEYLDVPTGKKLRLHRQAARNLNAVLGSENDEYKYLCGF